MNAFDLVVVGAGHAGCEAAWAAARLGLRVLALTLDLDRPARMSCNPAMGGPGKSQLLREIDALGGIAPSVADRCAIAVRTLNRTRGASARAARAQCDRDGYSAAMLEALLSLPGLTLHHGEAVDLRVENGAVSGVTLRGGLPVPARAVVVACGTFLRGTIHIGTERRSGGRLHEPSSVEFSESLLRHGLRPIRFKTGTPPRVDLRTVDLSRLTPEPAELPPRRFCLRAEPSGAPRDAVCHALRTTPATRALLLANLDASALHSGTITGVGPRYCPSLEAKFVRHPEKESHPLFLEPDGRDTCEGYLSGFSNSLPAALQEELVRTLPGFERARLMAPGYAVEYDAFDPRDLSPTLASRVVRGLYLAGQVNGTSGYEEAAAQGLVAGANAAFALLARPAWSPSPAASYIGAMIGDLVTRGVDEPYRMMPSRVENRLALREDNADLRLAEEGRTLGLLPEGEAAVLSARAERIARETGRLAARRIRPGDPRCAALLARHPDAAGRTFAQFLKRPGAAYAECAEALDAPLSDPEDALTAETEIKYEGYLARERAEIASRKRLEGIPIPQDLDLGRLANLSAEARERFARRRPATIDEASRTPGVTSADIAALLARLRSAPSREAPSLPEGATP